MLADFGAAKRQTLWNITLNQTIVGTKPYMAPEILMNLESNEEENIENFDLFKIDVFSMGLVFYEFISLKDIRGMNSNENIL